ncbi:MAG: hypothetical protein H0T62_04600 [Parachlamydiaceae bacterium]|nr:hypothetical protein [Parachlamydiaceae bacterium]
MQTDIAASEKLLKCRQMQSYEDLEKVFAAKVNGKHLHLRKQRHAFHIDSVN